MYQIFVVCADRFCNCIEYSRTLCVVYKCVDLMISVLVPRNAIKLHLLQRGKGDVLPPMQSMKKKFAGIKMGTILYKKL